MNDFRIQCQIRLVSGAGGRKRIVDPEQPAPQKTVPGRTARASRLMALAIHFDELLRGGVVRDYAQLARLGHFHGIASQEELFLATPFATRNYTNRHPDPHGGVSWLLGIDLSTVNTDSATLSPPCMRPSSGS